jgi:hypothetical protein
MQLPVGRHARNSIAMTEFRYDGKFFVSLLQIYMGSCLGGPYCSVPKEMQNSWISYDVTEVTGGSTLKQNTVTQSVPIVRFMY